MLDHIFDITIAINYKHTDYPVRIRYRLQEDISDLDPVRFSSFIRNDLQSFVKQHHDMFESEDELETIDLCLYLWEDRNYLPLMEEKGVILVHTHLLQPGS